LCFSHPTNCWKVACCVFQTGKLNFSQSFIDEEVQLHIDGLEKEKAKIEVELEGISEEVNQAKLIHEVTKSMLAEDDNRTIEKLIPERRDEYNAFIQDIENRDPSFKEYIKGLLAFDQRLSPIVNDEIYTNLKQKKDAISFELKSVDKKICHYKNLSTEESLKYRSEMGEELNDYFDDLTIFFKNALETQLLAIIQKPKKLTAADIHEFLAGFQAYRPLCEIQEFQLQLLRLDTPMNLLSIISVKGCMTRLSFKGHISRLKASLNQNREQNQQIISNIDEISPMIDKELFAEYMEKYAKAPISNDLIFSRDSTANKIHAQLESIPLEFIKEALTRSIFNQNRDVLSTMSTENAQIEPSLEEIEQILCRIGS
jgi:hypothetical protein